MNKERVGNTKASFPRLKLRDGAKPHLMLWSLLLWGVLSLVQPQVSQADLIEYNVSLDTSGLSSSNDYALDFFFFNGGIAGNSDVVFSIFNYSGGATGSQDLAGDLFADNDTNDFVSNFLTQPGQISFSLNFDYTVDDPAPDMFAFAIRDTSDDSYIVNPNDPDNLDDDNPFLFTIGFEAGSPDVTIYDGFEQNGTPVNFNTQVAATPEPGTWAMMGVGLLGLVWVRRKKRSAGAV